MSYSDPAMIRSNFERRGADSYFTLDANVLIPGLARVAPFLFNHGAAVYDSAAGAGHLMTPVESMGIAVKGTDLFSYPDQREDITAKDLFAITVDDLRGVGSIVTNLPYDRQDEAVAHLLPLCCAAGIPMAVLTRAEWPIAKARSLLIHNHPAFDTLALISRRPRWSTDNKASPRFYFAWCIWNPRRQYGPARVVFV